MIVLLLGLMASHFASIGFLSQDRHDAVIMSSQRLCADRIATMAKLLDRRSGDIRTELAAEMDSPTLHIVLGPLPGIEPHHHDEDDLPIVSAAFTPYFGAVVHPRLHVTHRVVHDNSHRSWWRDAFMGFPRDQVMQVSFQLSDGSWANFTLEMPQTVNLWSPHAVGSVLIMVIGIVVLGIWATRWVGRPARTFAQAADRLGRNVAAPPLPEDGPLEMRQAVAAFNDMQRRIQRFVEDRTRMVAAISHDLRSPLTRLRLRTEILPETEPRTQMLNDIDEMEGMVASTLEFARGEAADEPAQAIDLAATLDTICDNASDVGLSAYYARDGRLICTCRPMALKRALTNLVENAARYGKQADVRTSTKDGVIKVTIEDEGPGIPESEMEKVFMPFYRLDQSRNRKTGGVGLGMTVARSIIRAHGGDIYLDNKPQGGLHVTVTLPQELGKK